MSQLQIRKFKKDSFIYGVGGAFSKGLGLILLPVYTRLFTPVEYGIIEIFTMINVFLGLFLNMGLDSAQTFYFFEQKKEGGKQKQAQLVTAILQCKLTIGLLITIFAMGISPLLNVWLFGGYQDWSLFPVAFASVFFSQITIQSAHIFQLLFRPWYYLGITFLQNLFAAAIAIGLIVWLDMGFLGYFLGLSLGAFIAGIVGWWLAREYIDWSASNMQLLPRILKFGAPLVPANFAFYCMETADKWILGFYHGGIALGIYAVGAKFALAMGLVVEPFRKAWGPLAYKSLHEPESYGFFSFMARLYMGVGAAAAVLLTAVSPALVKWVTLPNYHSAYHVVGLLAWKQLFYGFFLFSALGIYKKEKTKLVAILSGFIATLNVTLLYFLVPEYAGPGAALAMVVSYFVWNLLALAIGQRLWPIDYPWAILLGQISVGLFATGMLILFLEEGVGIFGISLFATVSSVILIGSAVQFRQYQSWFKTLNLQYNLWKN